MEKKGFKNKFLIDIIGMILIVGLLSIFHILALATYFVRGESSSFFSYFSNTIPILIMGMSIVLIIRLYRYGRKIENENK